MEPDREIDTLFGTNPHAVPPSRVRQFAARAIRQGQPQVPPPPADVFFPRPPEQSQQIPGKSFEVSVFFIALAVMILVVGLLIVGGCAFLNSLISH